MTIKKTIKVQRPDVASPAGGGNGAIADRFRLDAPDPAAARAALVSKKAATAAFVAALISVGVAGLLTYTLWKHWEFLMPA